MAAIVDSAGNDPRRQRRLLPRASSAPTASRSRSRATPLVDHLSASAERPVPLHRRGQGGAALAHRPGPGRRRPRGALRLPAPRRRRRPARRRRDRAMSTPCSTACRSASRWPTATAASSSSTRCSARRSASPQSERPSWPGDLVVDEDKAAVSDAVRRFGRGRAMSGDLAVRLRTNPEEPVAMTVAGARGLGNAAVLLQPQGQ